MPRLYLSNRPELAIMACAIQKAQEVFAAQSGGGYLGRTALQKIMYFLVRKGVPLPYTFEIYHYGPFCSDIYHDVECLQADGVVIDKAEPSDQYWNYAPGSNMQQLVSEFWECIKPYEAEIAQVASIFADLPPQDLELIATLDYLYQDEKFRYARPPEKRAVVDRFVGVKKNKFPREQVEQMYDVLLKAGIFEG